jgi:hypothetical protein
MTKRRSPDVRVPECGNRTWRRSSDDEPELLTVSDCGRTNPYGGLASKTLLTRTLAIFIGVCGMLVTALVNEAGRSVSQGAVPEQAQMYRFQIFYMAPFYMAPLTTPNPALQRSGA